MVTPATRGVADTSTEAPPRLAVLEEIAQLAWALGVHAEVIERYAALGHVVGVDLAAKDARACLIRLLDLRKEITGA